MITQTLRNIEGMDCIEYDCTACESTMGYVKSTPIRGVKQYLKLCAYKEKERWRKPL